MLAAVAWADPIANNIDTTVDPTLESVTILAGGSVSVGFYDISSNTDPTNSDANGCNSTGSTPSTVTLSVPANVTATPSSFSLVGCGDTNASTVSLTSSVPGSYTISIASVTGGKSGSTWNTAPASFTLNVNPAPVTDTTPPVITPNVSGTLGDNGWYVSDVTVSWTVVDNESAISSSSGCSATTITSDTVGTTLTCTATSAGGTASQSLTIKRDATAPSIVLNAAADSCSVPGSNGWCRGEQTAGFTATDGTSGLASDGAASRSFTKSTTTNGSSVDIASGVVSDIAGNSNSGINAGPFKIDSVAPAVTCQSPAPSFVLNQPGAQVSATVTDATSLPVNTAETGAADTTSVGSKSVTITGSDNAGNSTTSSCSYTVGFNFDGLFAPIDRPNTMNVSKAGQAIPLRWRLTDYFGAPVTNLSSVQVTVSGVSCTLGTSLDLVEEVPAGSSGLQNLGDGYYQFNWKTPTSYAGSCKSLNLDLGEGTARTGLALISFKK